MAPRLHFVSAWPLVLVLCVAQRAAAGPDQIAPSTPAPAEESLLQQLDRYHEAASSHVVSFGEGMDGWLARRLSEPPSTGEKDHARLIPREESEGSEGSQITVSPSIFFRESDGLKFSLQARGRLRLPRFSERLELVFDSDDDDRTVTPESSRGADLGLRRGDDSTASLRYRFAEDWKFKPSIEAGLKFKPEPTPRLGLRLRLKRHFALLDARLTQSLFWDRGEGYGSRTTIGLEQYERDRYLRRFTTSLLWTEESEGAQGALSLQGFKYLSNRRAIGLKLGLNGPVEPSARVDLYSAHLVWRQRLHRDWVFLEIEPGVDWPRDRDYDAAPLIRVKLDLLFGRQFDSNGGGGAPR